MATKHQICQECARASHCRFHSNVEDLIQIWYWQTFRSTFLITDFNIFNRHLNIWIVLTIDVNIKRLNIETYRKISNRVDCFLIWKYWRKFFLFLPNHAGLGSSRVFWIFLQTNSIAVKRCQTRSKKRKMVRRLLNSVISGSSHSLVEWFIEGDEKVAACTRGRRSGSGVKPSLLHREDVLFSLRRQRATPDANTKCYVHFAVQPLFYLPSSFATSTRVI